MTTKSIFQKLNSRDAILNVLRDQVMVLRPGDTRSAIGTRGLDGSSCLVLMGTIPNSAIMMAHISLALPGGCVRDISLESPEDKLTESDDGSYDSLLQMMVSIFVKEQEQFQLPLAWVDFNCHARNGCPPVHQMESISKIFQHLHIELHLSICGSSSERAAQLSHERAILAVRNETEIPELYIENRLVYPKVHSGSLALHFNKLGLQQVDHEQGDDEFGDGESGEDDEKTNLDAVDFNGGPTQGEKTYSDKRTI